MTDEGEGPNAARVGSPTSTIFSLPPQSEVVSLAGVSAAVGRLRLHSAADNVSVLLTPVVALTGSDVASSLRVWPALTSSAERVERLTRELSVTASSSSAVSPLETLPGILGAFRGAATGSSGGATISPVVVSSSLAAVAAPLLPPERSRFVAAVATSRRAALRDVQRSVSSLASAGRKFVSARCEAERAAVDPRAESAAAVASPASGSPVARRALMALLREVSFVTVENGILSLPFQIVSADVVSATVVASLTGVLPAFGCGVVAASVTVGSPNGSAAISVACAATAAEALDGLVRANAKGRDGSASPLPVVAFALPVVVAGDAMAPMFDSTHDPDTQKFCRVRRVLEHWCAVAWLAWRGVICVPSSPSAPTFLPCARSGSSVLLPSATLCLSAAACSRAGGTRIAVLLGSDRVTLDGGVSRTPREFDNAFAAV